jgi:hypothetical protein
MSAALSEGNAAATSTKRKAPALITLPILILSLLDFERKSVFSRSAAEVQSLYPYHPLQAGVSESTPRWIKLETHGQGETVKQHWMRGPKLHARMAIPA